MKNTSISSNFEIIEALAGGFWKILDSVTGRYHEVSETWLEEAMSDACQTFAESVEVYGLAEAEAAEPTFISNKLENMVAELGAAVIAADIQTCYYTWQRYVLGDIDAETCWYTLFKIIKEVRPTFICTLTDGSGSKHMLDFATIDSVVITV